ncbi:MAG: N-acetylmuramoyl-L-alanine amidase [Eubacteriales bacterium]|nr:N-acetylmuramoyl-L-alanine amidase [Eubacteriales bacterium]
MIRNFRFGLVLCLCVFGIVAFILASCNYYPSISETELSAESSEDRSGYVDSSDESYISSVQSDEWSSEEDTSDEISSSFSESSYFESGSDPQPSPTPTIYNKIYVITGRANLRTGPSTEYDVIKKLNYGSSLQVLTLNGNWYQVVFADELTGFIHDSQISDSEPDPDKNPSTITPSPFIKWPQETSVGELWVTDMEKFIGRYKGEGYKPLEGAYVILDAGHGGRDPGAVFYNSSTGRNLLEKVYNLEIVNKLAEELRTMGAQVILTRENDEYVGLYRRNAIVNKFIADRILAEAELSEEVINYLESISAGMQVVIDANSDKETYDTRGIMNGLGASPDYRRFLDISAQMKDVIFISIHCNSYPQDKSVNGFEVYYGHADTIRRTEEKWLREEPHTDPVNPSYYMYDHDSRLDLSLLIRDKLALGTDVSVRTGNNEYEGAHEGVYEGDFCVIRENNVAGALVEVGFLTNSGDRGFFSDPAGQRRIAYSIADAVYEYFCFDRTEKTDKYEMTSSEEG